MKFDSCVYHHFMARPPVVDRGDGLQMWTVAVNI
jgi:hypothetical protein